MQKPTIHFNRFVLDQHPKDNILNVSISAELENGSEFRKLCAEDFCGRLNDAYYMAFPDHAAKGILHFSAAGNGDVYVAYEEYFDFMEFARALFASFPCAVLKSMG